MTQRYDTYKDSGVQWLGEIPGHWEMRKMKYIFDERSEKNHPDEPMLSATQSEGVILQSKYQGRVVVVNTGFEGLKLVKVGDFVIHLRSFQGGIEYAYDQGIISAAYTILNPKYPEFSAYYKRLFKSSSFIDLLKICVTGIREGQNINYSKLKQFFIPLPPLSEQRSIVSFLDAKCGMIDEWVTKKQKEVEHLQELKQRVIADAVTRGLNPHVKMKATNIPWLKEIPEHWECVFINRLFNIKAGGDVKPELYADKKDENHPFPVYTNTKSADDVYAYTSLATCPSNSITVTGRGEIGHAIFRETPYDAIVRLLSLTPKSNIICKFYAYFIDTVIPFSSDSAAIGQLSAVQIKQKHVTIPPLSEQEQIVSYLDTKCAKIDKLITNITKEIDCIKEYKQRLISDVVTGQIKVC